MSVFEMKVATQESCLIFGCYTNGDKAVKLYVAFALRSKKILIDQFASVEGGGRRLRNWVVPWFCQPKPRLRKAELCNKQTWPLFIQSDVGLRKKDLKKD